MSRSRGAFTLVGLVLLFVVVGTAGAASRESVLYAFHGKDGWERRERNRGFRRQFVRNDDFWGRLHCPGSGGVGCGVVFRLARDANGMWRETVLHAFADNNTDGSLRLEA